MRKQERIIAGNNFIYFTSKIRRLEEEVQSLKQKTKHQNDLIIELNNDICDDAKKNAPDFSKGGKIN